MTVETFTISKTTGKVSITKDPEADLDYTFDWTDWLAAASDPPDYLLAGGAGAEAFIEAGTSTAVVGTILHDASKVTIWVSGGEVGEQARLTCRIHTNGGRDDDRSVFLKIKSR